MAGNVAPNIVTDGLVLYLDAANTKSYVSGSTSWNDITSNIVTGSLINGPTFDSANGGNISFDGTNDYVNLGNILNIGLNSWTMSCWAKLNSSVLQGIMGKTSARSYVGRYALFIENNLLYVLFQPSAGNVMIGTSVFPYIDGKFHYMVLTINRTGFMSFYIDGVAVGNPQNVSAFSNVDLNSSTDFLYIGSYANNTGQSPLYPFNGNVAMAQIYNRALSASEVLQNYNSTKGRFGL